LALKSLEAIAKIKKIKNRKKSKEWKRRKIKKTDIPFHLYIVYFGAGCDFFNTVFINPDLHIKKSLSS